MLKTFEATVDEQGHIKTDEPTELLPGERALITILDGQNTDLTEMSEEALASDWMRPEEDVAWSHLRPAR